MKNAPIINYNNTNCLSFTQGDGTWFISYESPIMHIQKQTSPSYRGTDYILVALGDDYNRSKTTARHLNAMLDNFSEPFAGGHYFGRTVYIKKEDLSPNYQRFADHLGLVNLSEMDNPHRRSILDDFYLNQIKKK